MPPKRKSAGATMAKESSITPSKMLKATVAETQPSGDGESEVRAFSEADRQQSAPAGSLDPQGQD